MDKTTLNLCREAIEHLKNSGRRVEITSSGKIKIDGEAINNNSVFGFIQTLALENVKFQPLLLTPMPEVVNSFRIILVSVAKERPQYTQVPIQSYDYSKYIPFQSITDGGKYIIFDTETNKITDLDYSVFKSNPETSKMEVVRGRIEFNPYSPKPLEFKEDAYGRSCNFLNTYNKPSWQYSENIGVDKGGEYKPSPLFFDFMAHLIPDSGCREFVFDWLHYALTDRCETYLVLNGAKGIGKNLFSEHLCKPLMGPANHKIAQPSALTSDFNAILEDSRMIVFDEFKVDSSEKINKLKRYVNEEQMIEKKGIDVAATTKTYNSFIISNNDMTDMKISWDDRRFSVIDLTKVKLRDAWKEKDIDALIALFENDDNMRDIGYWLMYREPKYSKFDAWKGKHFYDLCYSSFTEWQKVIIDLAASNTLNDISAADVKREYRKRTEASRLPSFVKVRDFIENYRHEGQHRLGTLVASTADNWYISLDDMFRPKEGDFDAFEGDLLA